MATALDLPWVFREASAVLERRISLGIFWVACLYICGASLYSVIPQVYSHTTQSPIDCKPELAALRDELHSISGGWERASSDRTKLLTHFAQWDSRYRSAEQSCSANGEAYRVLGRLRYATQSWLDRGQSLVSPHEAELASLLSK